MSQAYSIRAPFLAGGGLGLVCFFLTLVIPRPERPLGPAPEWSEMLPQLSRLRRLMNAVLCLPCFSLSLVHFLQMMGLGILITSAPVLTADKLGWSPTEIAAGLALGGLLAALLSPWLGSLSDRFGRVWVMGAGLAVMALEGAALFFHPGTVLTMTALAVGGTGAPAYFNAFYSLEGDITQPQERGAVTGFVGSFGEWGSIIGSSLLTPLLWKAVDISAPMALNAAVLTATVGITIIMKPVLERQVGRRSVKHTERPPRA
jgi:MFS family permease